MGWLGVVVGGGGLGVGDHGRRCSPRIMKNEDMKAGAGAEAEVCVGAIPPLSA